jgi:hypothetical protein
MDHERDKAAIREKLARCQALAKEFTSEPAATRLRELEAEFQMQLLDAEQ